MARTKHSKQVALAWRDIAVEEIRKKMAKLKVHDTYELIRSVQMYISDHGADSYKATLLYNYYGIFPDMGVGKGQQAFDVSVNKLAGSTRKRKNWTREIAAQRHRFGEVLADNFADAAVEKISKSLSVGRSIRIDM